jgi:uncharacterized protein YheU (UPF0270 family)
MLIPYTALPSDTLAHLLADYVTRDGTDNGAFTTEAERKLELLSALEREEVFITFNYEYQQACLVKRADVDPVALREFQALNAPKVNELSEDLRLEAQAEKDFRRLHARLTVEGFFPIYLGRTMMQRDVNILLQAGTVALTQLQDLLHMHSMGDYGEVCWLDRLSNLKTIIEKGYLLSRYTVNGISLIVETLDGHSQTMVMDRR